MKCMLPVRFMDISFTLKTGEQPTKMGCKLRTFEVEIINEFVYVKKPTEKRFDFNF